MTQSIHLPTHAQIESLFVNNGKLDQVDAWINRFNPIRTMRMEDMEIRHSAILAWLLDPRETHGFRDRFLRSFLAEALRSRKDISCPTALEVYQSDMNDAEIRREWKKIDIFIHSPRNRWSFIIENKYRSAQRKGQLAEYKLDITDYFTFIGSRTSVCGIFLTLSEEPPEDNSYNPIQYTAVVDILSRLLDVDGEYINPEARAFVNYYLDIIKEETGMSNTKSDMEKLARELYVRHKKVIDFIVEYGSSTDFVLALESIFGSNNKFGEIIKIETGQYVYFSHTSYRYAFLPLSWHEALGFGKLKWKGCENWWAGDPLICWFELAGSKKAGQGQLRLHAEVGPLEDFDFRTDLIRRIQDAAETNNLKDVRFQEGALQEGRKFSRFLKNNTIHLDDIQNAESIANAARKLLDRFSSYFEKISAILTQFQCQAERNDLHGEL